MTTEKLLFALLRAAACGEPVGNDIKRACTPEALEQVCILAKKHDLAHMPGQVLTSLGLPECEALKKLQSATLTAVQRYVQLEY